MEQTTDELISKNLNFVWHFVNKLEPPHPYDEDDLFQIGCIGLIKAARSYDPSKKAKFATYAAKCIRNELYTACQQARKSQVVEVVGLNSELLQKRSQELLSPVEHNALMNDLIRKVSELDDGVVQMTIAGKSQEAIGSELGLSQSYVSRKLRRAREQLREGQYV